MRRIPRTGLAVAAVLTASLAAAGAAQASDGAVYTLTNEPGGNAVAAFERAGDGSLTPDGVFPTGGTGTGGSLGNQGALVLGHGSRHLFAVDAGSDEISALAVRRHGLRLVDTVPSGGDTPVSVTVHRDLLYVLNAGGAGGPGNISGFRIGRHGQLRPIDGSTRPLSAPQVGPAQIELDPSGSVLVVTEKATNVIDTYTVGRDGRPSGPDAFASSGHTPFGFAFAGDDTLIVSEAFGGTASAHLVRHRPRRRAGDDQPLGARGLRARLVLGRRDRRRSLRVHHQHGVRLDLELRDRPPRLAEPARRRRRAAGRRADRRRAQPRQPVPVCAQRRAEPDRRLQRRRRRRPDDAD